jgi:hypothetical protein
MAAGGLMPIKAPLFAVFTPQLSAARVAAQSAKFTLTPNAVRRRKFPVHRERRPVAT